MYEGFHLTPLKLGPTGGPLGTDHGIRSKQRIGRADAEQIARDVAREHHRGDAIGEAESHGIAEQSAAADEAHSQREGREERRSAQAVEG